MSWSTVIRRTDGSTHTVPSRERFTMQTGDVLDCITAGGGGYGDPLERPAGAVLEDHRDSRVSRAQAQSAYGVVIDDQGALDEQATARMRAKLRDQRGAITWTYDRGDDRS
jgi:N-methylhydantoinase B